MRACKIWPWDAFKACPKCSHPNLTTGTYYPEKDKEPEHLSISCGVCGYQYLMAPKEPG